MVPAAIFPGKLRSWYEKGFVVPLVREFKSQLDLWQIAGPILSKSPNAFLLDSVRFQGNTARYSYLGWKPFRIFRTKEASGILFKLRNFLKPYRGQKWREYPFFTGGAVGYFSYELARAFERLPDIAKDDLDLDLVSLLLVRDLLVFDHKENTYFLISNLVPSEDGPFDRAFDRASQRMEKNLTMLFARHPEPPGARHSEGEARRMTLNRFHISNFHANLSKGAFKRMVLTAKEHICAGDIYQANLSQRFSFEFEGSPETLYGLLRETNPSPFSSFLKIGPLTVLSTSPERLIKLDGRASETRPIAGTRPRGNTPKEERHFRRDLIMSPKERAEHIMLVDLERNDLGRVCESESVHVNELMTIEPYSHVVHIVSNVSGRLRKECDRFDLLRAIFPGGTITGCPKIRSMEIIEELEPFKRHLYTGSIGFLDFNGDMDLNIVIRSLILHPVGHSASRYGMSNGVHRGKGYLQVGAGIVYDSDPEAEYWETLHKGKALIDALSLHA